MLFYSTNNKNIAVSLKEAALNGLAPDGGLYMPEKIPKFPSKFFRQAKHLSFQEISFEIAKKFFFGDIPQNDLEEITHGAVNFDAPLKPLAGNIDVLELFHGPTLAFKDFAAGFMARLMAYFVKDSDKELTVLTATSGDTGSAVAHGFFKAPGIRVIILYPSKKVSEMQEKMLATMGENITALEIQGTFDDCQRLVKQAFADKDLKQKLFLTSANSINIIRLIPQIFYYIYAFARLDNYSPSCKREAGRDFMPLIFSVPSGNFGNLTAGLLAKRMGLPVFKFIAATNINDVVPRYLENGIYLPHPAQKTLSNAMDVGDPSNFARMLELYDNDVRIMKKDIIGMRCADEETVSAIKDVYRKYNYILDPHGAVGYFALKKYLDCWRKAAPRAIRARGIFLETAHQAKFADTVEDALKIKILIPKRLSAYLDKEKKAVLLPADFAALKEFLTPLHSA